MIARFGAASGTDYLTASVEFTCSLPSGIFPDDSIGPYSLHFKKKGFPLKCFPSRTDKGDEST